MIVITGILQIRQIPVQDVICRIIMLPQIQTTVPRSFQRTVQPVMMKQDGLHHPLIMTACISRYTAASIRASGVAVLTAIRILRTMLSSHVSIVMSIAIRTA